MAKFTFEAISPQGKRVKGKLEAANGGDAQARLSSEGFEVLSVSDSVVAGSKPLFGGGVKPKELQIFSRQMATLVSAGVHLSQSLELMASGAASPTLKKCLLDIRDQVASGKGLSEAMSKYPQIFDRLYMNMVAAGEEGGVLDIVLTRLAQYLEKSVKLRGQVKSALWYPVSIIIVATIVILAIVVFVIPQFQSLFANSGKELPGLTMLVISLSEFVIGYWYLLLAGVVATAFSLHRWYLSDSGRAQFDTWILKVPIFGALIRNNAVARFTRTLSTLISSGVPIVEALEISANVTGNKVIEDVVRESKESITRGRTISENFSRSKVIPGMVSQMISVGEQTGTLDEMLNKVADFYEDEVDNSVTAMTSIIEPILMVVLGGIIAVLVIAMYLPIFNLAEVIG